MKSQFLLLCFLFPFLAFAQEGKNIVVTDPKRNDSLQVSSYNCPYQDEQVSSYNCPYLDGGAYLINKDFVVYENCSTRKILHLDKASLRFPPDNFRSLFALDKNGVYFDGEKITTDTTGFDMVGYNTNYQKPEFLWKTRNAVYKNREKVTVSDVATFSALGYLNGPYFKDKNFVYYFDQKIEGSDGATVQKSYNDFTYDKNNSYINGKIVTHEGERIVPVNRVFYKTEKAVLVRNWETFRESSGVDAATLRHLSERYAVDKNHVYYDTAVLPVKKENLPFVKVWDQTYAYLSDGQKVYSSDNDLENNFDAKSFGMLPHSDFCFDENGVYEVAYSEAQKKAVYVKLPFTYTALVTPENLFITPESSYIIYENQAYNIWNTKTYENLTAAQIALVKEDQLSLEKVNRTAVEVDQNFDYLLYKAGNKIYWDGKETSADAATFSAVGGTIYRDAKSVYAYSRGKGLITIQGMDSGSLEMINGFLMDKNYLYSQTTKIIRSEGLEILGIFTGYRPECSQDRRPRSNFYLFKNSEGYWLTEISNEVTVRYLGTSLPSQEKWVPNLKERFEM